MQPKEEETKRRTPDEINKEKERIYNALLKKSPLPIKEIYIKLSKKFPESTIHFERTNKKVLNPEYRKKVSKYIQIHIHNKGEDKKRPTLCEEKKVFRLNKDDKVWKIPAKKFMEWYWFEWEKQVHSYYFATPRTYKIKTEIFDNIIRKEILEKFGEEYIKNKKEIEKLLKEAEKIMCWIEIFPNVKEGYKGLYSSGDFIQYIVDSLCKGKNVARNLFIITDHVLVPVLQKIEDLFFFGTDDSEKTEINVYRILRRKLSEKGLAELPEEYEKHIKGKIFEKVLKMTHNKEIGDID